MSGKRPSASGGQRNSRNSKEKKGMKSKESKREIERIIGVTDDNGELEFGILFKGKDTLELVPARVANLEYPQHVIAYYEERLMWEGRDGKRVKAVTAKRRFT